MMEVEVVFSVKPNPGHPFTERIAVSDMNDKTIRDALNQRIKQYGMKVRGKAARVDNIFSEKMC